MKRYLLTGATGYIGTMLVDKLLQEGMDITVIVRNPECLEEKFRDKVKIVHSDIRSRNLFCKEWEAFDYIIHCAAPTNSAYMISNPVEVADTIIDGTRNMLRLAAKYGAKSMVYLSSMEVYGRIDCSNGRRIVEEELGDLDITSARSCYPMAKRMAENYCHLYHSEYNVPVKIARLSQTFGRGIHPDDNRVYVQFADSIRNNRDIVLHTRGNSVGNYCDIDDTVDAILYLLKYGKPAQTYNIVNEANTMTVREMAEMVVQKIAAGKIKVTYEIPDDNCYGYAAETGLRLSGEKMKELGWEARISLEDMYRKMLNNDISSNKLREIL